MPEAVEEDGDQRVSLLSTFDDSTLEGPVRERFLRNLRAVEAVLAGASIVETARQTQIARSTLSPLVQRTRKHGVLACVPHGTGPWQTRAVRMARKLSVKRVFPSRLRAPDDLKLLLMKAVKRKTPGHGYRVHDGSRLSFQGRSYSYRTSEHTRGQSIH